MEEKQRRRAITPAPKAVTAVVREQNAESLLAEIQDDLLNVVDRNGIDAAERFIKENELGHDGETSCDLHTPPFTAAQGVSRHGTDPFQSELSQKMLQHLAPVPRGMVLLLKDKAQIVLHREIAKHRRLLGKISHAEPCAPEHGQFRNIPSVHVDISRIGGDESDEHIEGRRLTRTVRTEQTDDFPLLHGEIHRGHDGLPTVTLDEAFRRKDPSHAHSPTGKVSWGFPRASMRRVTRFITRLWAETVRPA